jgi:hypothetical protein
MNDFYKIVAGIGSLIAIYLIVVNYQGTTSIISNIGSAGNSAIRNLQGR